MPRRTSRAVLTTGDVGDVGGGKRCRLIVAMMTSTLRPICLERVAVFVVDKTPCATHHVRRTRDSSLCSHDSRVKMEEGEYFVIILIIIIIIIIIIIRIIIYVQ